MMPDCVHRAQYASSEPLQWEQETLCGSSGGEAGQGRESEPWGGVNSTSPRGSAALATSHAAMPSSSLSRKAGSEQSRRHVLFKGS